jgi:hypothetical protein
MSNTDLAATVQDLHKKLDNHIDQANALIDGEDRNQPAHLSS